jgi:hypothetical protein
VEIDGEDFEADEEEEEEEVVLVALERLRFEVAVAAAFSAFCCQASKLCLTASKELGRELSPTRN